MRIATMVAAQTLSAEAEQNVVRIIRHDLEPITTKGVSINQIRIVPGEDQDGDPYHHIIVIYSGKDDLLDPAWLNGFKRRNRDELAKWGVHLTTESYIEDKEWSQASNVAFHEE